MKKNEGVRAFITGILTYLIVHIIYKLTGFYYNLGQLDYKLLIDISLWGIINFIVYNILLYSNNIYYVCVSYCIS